MIISGLTNTEADHVGEKEKKCKLATLLFFTRSIRYINVSPSHLPLLLLVTSYLHSYTMPVSSLPLTIDDYEELAQKSLNAAAYGYFRSGADSELTLQRNKQAYEKYEKPMIL